MARKIEITALQVKILKQECRAKGVEIFSIYTFGPDDLRDTSTIKDFIVRSNKSPPEIILILSEFFRQIGYRGKVSLRHVKEDWYNVLLANRLTTKSAPKREPK